MQPDSYSYDTVGFNIFAGHGYSMENHAPTMAREPAYPLFLAGIYLIFGYNHLVVQIIQIILFLLTVILVYKIADIIFGRRIAEYSMIVTAFFPTLANYPAYILSETLFTFLLCLSIFICIKLYNEDKWIYYVLAGFMLGIVALCKAIMLPFILIVFLWIVVLKRENLRNVLLKAICMVLIYIVTVAPWMYRNYAHFGSFSLREGSEGALCIKVQKLDYNLDDFKKSFVFTVSENLGKKIFPDAIEKPEDFLFKEDYLVRDKILPELKNKGYSSKEIKGMMIARIIKRPWKFLFISSLDLFKMTQFTYLPVLIDQKYIMEKFRVLRHGNNLLSLIRAVFRGLAYLLVLFSIIALFTRRALCKGWMPLFLVITYISLSYAIVYGHGRYSVPLIPYYIILLMSFILKDKKETTQ